MTNMAAMPIYVKNLKKYSSPEPIDWWPWKLVCSIVYASTTKIVQIVTLGWPWPILPQGQIWSRRLCMGKSEIYYFLITIATLHLKVAWSIQLNEFMKLNEYQRSRSFFDLGQRSLRLQCLNFFFSQKQLGHLDPKLIWKLKGEWERKFIQMSWVTWPRWPPCPYMVKTLKIFFSRTNRPMTLKHGM